jgi:AcrR family transcriptional regulator
MYAWEGPTARIRGDDEASTAGAGCADPDDGRALVARRTAEDAAQTRRDLLDAASSLFVEHGFASVSVGAIATAAGVTSGAVYHHFPGGKVAVFEAVYREQLELLDAAMRTASRRVADETGDLWLTLWAAVDSYLELCASPTLARITLYEAPAAIGVERWEEINQEFGVAQFRGMLELLMATGDIAEQPVEPLALALLGAFDMAARQILGADDPDEAAVGFGRALRSLIGGLAYHVPDRGRPRQD